MYFLFEQIDIFCPHFCIFIVEEVKKKWKNLTDSYKKCLNREKELTKSGSGAHKIPTCRLYNELHFMKDMFTHRTTSSNVNIPTPMNGATPLFTINSRDIDSLETTDFSATFSEPSTPQSPSLCFPASSRPEPKKRKRSQNFSDEIDKMLVEALNNRPSEGEIQKKK